MGILNRLLGRERLFFDLRVYPAAGDDLVKRALDGADLDGGIRISPAGPVLHLLAESMRLTLRSLGWVVPGFDHVYVEPTSLLTDGETVVDGPKRVVGHGLYTVRVGVPIETLRSICKGADLAAGVALLGRALEAVAHETGADTTVVEEASRRLLDGTAVVAERVGYPPPFNRRRD